MTKSRLFSIITIACFVSILCIPIGIVLMLYYTNWKKKLKLILSLSLTAFYAALIVFIFFVRPSINTSGIGLPFGSNSGYTAFDTQSSSPAKSSSSKGSSGKNKKKNSSLSPQNSNAKQAQGKKGNGALYPILFFLFILFLILWQNLRSKGKSNYENPYVDTNKYKLPLTPDAKMPMVHFLHVELDSDEKINFATETNQKDNEGNFVITDRRIIILNATQDVEVPLTSIQGISNATSTVLVITAPENKYYIFMPENQMKYAVAVLRWSMDKAKN